MTRMGTSSKVETARRQTGLRKRTGGLGRTPDGHLTDNEWCSSTPKPPKTLAVQGFSWVEVRGFEPLASSVRGKRSAGLSYTPKAARSLTRGRDIAEPLCQIAAQPLLDDGGGEICSAPLDQGPGDVGGPPQPSRHPIRVVEAGQQPVDRLHGLQGPSAPSLLFALHRSK